MSGLKRCIEWMSGGRRTNRDAYTLKGWDLPNPVPGAERQLDNRKRWLIEGPEEFRETRR